MAGSRYAKLEVLTKYIKWPKMSSNNRMVFYISNKAVPQILLFMQFCHGYVACKVIDRKLFSLHCQNDYSVLCFSGTACVSLEVMLSSSLSHLFCTFSVLI